MPGTPHFKRSIISDAIAEHHKIVVYAQAEDVLREQLGQLGNEWISATSIEEKLIRDLRLKWNLIGRGQEVSCRAELPRVIQALLSEAQKAAPLEIIAEA